jgi:hypothetical protein
MACPSERRHFLRDQIRCESGNPPRYGPSHESTGTFFAADICWANFSPPGRALSAFHFECEIWGEVVHRRPSTQPFKKSLRASLSNESGASLSGRVYQRHGAVSGPCSARRLDSGLNLIEIYARLTDRELAEEASG